MDIYLVDDGSIDGTATAVNQAYPEVKILQGDGSLFWNGGMSFAFVTAMKQDYNYYLWLNDDTLLYPETLSTLLKTSHSLIEQGETHAIVVGSTQDPDTGVFTYGGRRRSQWWHPFHFHEVHPKDTVQPCDTLNGNCVLIPQNVVQLVGNLDPELSHYAADLDYGLRAQQQGCTIWVAPGYAGTCLLNTPSSRRSKVNQLWTEQLRKVNQPKGLALEDVTLIPLSEWKLFTQRHGGLLWSIYWLLPYRRLLWLRLFGTNKSQ